MLLTFSISEVPLHLRSALGEPIATKTFCRTFLEAAGPWRAASDLSARQSLVQQLDGGTSPTGKAGRKCYSPSAARSSAGWPWSAGEDFGLFHSPTSLSRKVSCSDSCASWLREGASRRAMEETKRTTRAPSGPRSRRLWEMPPAGICLPG